MSMIVYCEQLPEITAGCESVGRPGWTVGGQAEIAARLMVARAGFWPAQRPAVPVSREGAL